jgi:hypothetical protein
MLVIDTSSEFFNMSVIDLKVDWFSFDIFTPRIRSLFF